MIKITVGTKGEDVFDCIEIKDTTLEECSIINYKLDQIKQDLLNLNFESKFEVREEDSEEEEESGSR